MLKLFSPRWRKVIRDVLDNKARTILVVLAIAVGVFAFGGIFITRSVLLSDMNTRYAATNPATIIFSMSPFDENLLRTARNLDGVEEVEAAAVITVQFQVPGQDRYMPLLIYAKPDFENSQVGVATVEQGEWPPGRRQLFLERGSLPYSGAQIGDTVTLELPDGTTKELLIAGTVHDFSAIPALFFPQLAGYTSLDTLEELGAGAGYSQLQITTAPEYDTIPELEVLGDQLTDRLNRYGYQVFFAQVQEPGKHWASDFIEAFTYILGVIGLLALALSGFLVVNTITAILSQQKRQVGMMKAIGARGGQIMGIYLVMAGVYGVLSLAVALPIGTLLGFAITALFSFILNVSSSEPFLVQLISFPFRIPLYIFGIQIIVALIAPLIAAFFPVLGGTRTTVREAISDYGIGGIKRSWIDRLVEAILGAVKGLSRPVMLSLRNTFRRKGRLTLTLLTLTLAGGMFISVINARGSLIGELYKILSVFGYNIQIALGEPVPVSKLVREGMRVEGVTRVEGWGFGSATRIRDDGVEGTQYTILAPPTDTQFVDPTILEGRWLVPEDTNALVISTTLLQQDPGVGVGDILLMDFGTSERQMIVVGIVSVVGVPFAYGNFDFITRVQGAPGESFVAMIGTAEDSAEFEAGVARAVEERFKRAGIPVQQSLTTSTLIGANITQFNILVGFMLFMAILLAVVGGLGLASTMSLNVMERTREIGVMRAVGASDRGVLGVFWTEGMIIGLMSWILSALIAIPMSYGIAVGVGVALLQFPMDFTYSPVGLIAWLALVLIISSLASLMPAIRASRVSVRESLAYE